MAENTALEISAKELKAEISRLKEAETKLAAIKGKVQTVEQVEKIRENVSVSRPAFDFRGKGDKDTVTGLLADDFENLIKTAVRGSRTLLQEKRTRARENDLDKREAQIRAREGALARREAIVEDKEVGLNAQRKNAQYFADKARVSEANYERVLRELNQLKGLSRGRER
jgi:ketosteroid isomerase-like protein